MFAASTLDREDYCWPRPVALARLGCSLGVLLALFFGLLGVLLASFFGLQARAAVNVVPAPDEYGWPRLLFCACTCCCCTCAGGLLLASSSGLRVAPLRTLLQGVWLTTLAAVRYCCF